MEAIAPKLATYRDDTEEETYRELEFTRDHNFVS